MPSTAPSLHASFRGAAARLFTAAMELLLGLVVSSGAYGCGSGSAPSPFPVPGAVDAGADSAVASLDGAIPPPGDLTDSGVREPGEWGGPCVDEGQCGDDIACTSDTCDVASHRCHFVSDDSSCDDGVFCNGTEQCIAGIGCRSGEPVACSDGTACTIDACDEVTHRCLHSARDADGDGDPDGNCPDGGDCNDRDPDVSSLHAEICDNSVDDDCDGQVDETDCESPAYDVCGAPLDVVASGAYPLSSAAAKQDYSASCLSTGSAFRDLVVALHVPAGAPSDVDVAVTTTSGNVALAAGKTCGDASSEIACAPGVLAPGRTYAARLVLHALAPGAHPLYVFSEGAGSLVLNVEFSPPSAPEANETCGTSAPITPGTHVIAHLPGTSQDVTSACGESFGELVYDFSLDAPRDVHVYANSLDLYGTPIVSLRSGSCVAPETELTCSASENAMVFGRALPRGRYFVSVGATGPSDVGVLLDTAPPTTPPADETCAGAPALAANQTIGVGLADHADDLQLGCGVGAVDAAYALTVDAPSDVLLVLGISNGDTGSVSLAYPACSRGAPLLACASASTTPVRAIARSVPAGDYRVVVESTFGSPVDVVALTRPAAPALVVPFSDACDGALVIPSSGGRLQGNTSNSLDDFTASCDVGGASGARDQILSFHLDADSRVVLDARGSSFAVILDVRSGAACPGEEVPHGCSAGYDAGRSFLDLDLPAGDYWIQVDGYSGATGAWVMDAFIVPK